MSTQRTPHLIVRNADPGDIPLVRDLAFRIWPHAYSAILSAGKIGYMLDLMYSEDSLKKQMQDGVTFLLADDGEEPVGFAAYQEIMPSVYKLHKLYVLPSQQGKGTGRFLLDHIIAVIGPAGGNSLQLQVNRENQAKNFYEKYGFHIIDEIDLDIGNGFFMNDYVMELKIGS